MEVHRAAEPPPARPRRNAASGYSLRVRTGSAEYPSRWTKGDKALSDLKKELDRKPWVPDHAAGAVLICFRTDASKLIDELSVEDARRIDAERAGGRCGKPCEGVHGIVHAEPGRLRIEMTDPPKRRIPSR